MLFSAAVRVRLARWGSSRSGVPLEQATVPSVCSPRSAILAIAAGALLATACGSSSHTQTFSGPSAVRCALRLESGTAAFPPAGGSGTVRVAVSRDCTWTAKTGAAWVILSASEGQGDGSIRFTVASHADPSSRTGEILVNDQRLQIVQEGKPCEFSVSSTRETVDGAGGDRIVEVRASAAPCGWTASPNVSWISIVSGREGRGDGEVKFHVDAVNGPPRTGTLSVAGRTVHVEQGTGCTYSIGTDTFSVDAAGGERQVAVSAGAGCAWTADTDAAWITITSGSTGSGPGVVGFRVAATDGPARTGTLRVAGRAVTVVQSPGCTVSVNPANLNESARGGSAAIRVDTAPGCPWSAETDVAWITLTGAASGSGTGQVQAAIAANAGPARTGSVIIAGQRVAITQASGCTYAVMPAAQQIPPSGGPAASSVSTASGCAWTATGAVEWITITNPLGSGSGQATFVVAPNQGPFRSATLTIAGRIHTVNQSSLCAWSFNPPFHEFAAPGGFGTVLVFVTGACTWTGTSTVDWIRVVAGATGAGEGMVQFTVAPNNGPARTGVVLIGGEKYLVKQAAP